VAVQRQHPAAGPRRRFRAQARSARTAFVIIDLEYPRRDLIRIHAADQVLLDLRAQMK
jgi:hypothetical protein